MLLLTLNRPHRNNGWTVTLTDWERGAEGARLRSLVLMSEMGQHPDFLEGVTSFQEKRARSFQGLDAQLHVNRSINR